MGGGADGSARGQGGAGDEGGSADGFGGGDAGASQAAMVTSYLVNPAHTNSVMDATLVPPLGVLWSVPSVGGYPLIAGGRVYVNTAPASADGAPQLEALDETTGKTLWGPVNLGGSYLAGDAYDDARVFTYTDAGQLQAFDAATGATLWTQTVGEQPFAPGPPTAYRGAVYVPTSGGVTAFDEGTGAAWWNAIVDGASVASPAVTDDGVFVSAGCGGTFAFDRTTGAVLWKTGPICDGGGANAPSVFEGRVYVQSPDPTVPLTALDVHTGANLGSFCAFGFPAFDGTLGFCDLRTDLAALDVTTDATQWTFGVGLNLNLTPFAAAGTIFVGADTGKLYGIDEHTGAQVWSTQADPLGAAGPVGGEGTLLAGTYTGGLVAYRHIDLPDAGVTIGDGGPVTPSILASGEESPTGLALSPTRVYWTDYGTGLIRSVDKNGGPPVTVDSAPGTYPWGITVDDTNVYWTVPNFYSGGMNPAIMSIPIAGGTASTLAASAGGPELVVVSSTHAYWENDNAVFLQSVPLDGGSVATLANTQGGGGGGLAIDATNVYWSTSAGIFAESLAGGPPTTLTPGAAAALAVDATNIYYVTATSNGSGVVAFVPIAGGTPTTLASGRTGSLVAVAVDAQNVYWIEGEGTIAQGAVAAVPKSGGMVSVLAPGLSDPSAIAVDDSGIYFNNPAGGGNIEKIAK